MRVRLREITLFIWDCLSFPDFALSRFRLFFPDQGLDIPAVSGEGILPDADSVQDFPVRNRKKYPMSLIVPDKIFRDAKRRTGDLTPYRRGWIGFRFNPGGKWRLFVGNADGKGSASLIQIRD